MDVRPRQGVCYHGDGNIIENGNDDALVFSLVNNKSRSTFSASASANNVGHDRDNNNNGHIYFDLEYHIRTEAIDPPVHYTRMRHIVAEYSNLEGILTTRVVQVLRRVRE
jgi:hypothetical protein